MLLNISITKKDMSIYLILILPMVLAPEATQRKFDFFQNDYKFQFERTELLRFNPELVEKISVVTFKYNRTYPAVNITASFKKTFNGNVQVVIQAYKFLSNEYRLFPLRFQVNYCDAVEKNLGGLEAFKKCGNVTSCATEKGKIYRICNWQPDQSKLPPYMPNGQFMVEMQTLLLSKEIYVLRTYGTVSRPIYIPK